MTRIMAALLLVGSCLPALAGDLGVGLQYSHLAVDRGNLNRGNPGLLVASGTRRLSESYVFEARVGTGVVSECCFGPRLENDSLVGGYLVSSWWELQPVNPYLIAGYTATRTLINGVRFRDDGFSWGLGARQRLSPEMELRFEAMRLLENDYGRQDSLSVGVSYQF